MLTLGASGTKELVYLAFSNDDIVLDLDPLTLELPKGLDSDRQLHALSIEIRKVLTMHKVQKIRVLEAEPSYKAPYKDFCTRIAIETVLLMTASELELNCGRITRPRVRALLGLPKKGTLSEAGKESIFAVGKYWTGKRDLAAMAALAGNKES